MPIVPLQSSGNKPLHLINSFKVLWAIMLSPGDVESVLTHLYLLEGDPSELRTRILERRAKRALGGSVAGNVFIVELQLRQYLPAGFAKTTKAFHLLSESLKREYLPNGHKAPSSLIQIRKFWDEYRKAAHLWGAYCMLEHSDQLPFGGSATISKKERLSRIYTFIMYADYLLGLAVELNFNFCDDPWILPPKFPRKSVVLPRIAPPDEWTLSTLSYKSK
jgi:hypothetical protein